MHHLPVAYFGIFEEKKTKAFFLRNFAHTEDKRRKMRRTNQHTQKRRRKGGKKEAHTHNNPTFPEKKKWPNHLRSFVPPDDEDKNV